MRILGTTLISALIFVLYLVLLKLDQKPLTPDREGWKRLRPGWLLNGMIVSSAGLALLFAYIFLFVGSSREDADTQMKWALGLIVVLGACSTCAIWSCYRRTIMWRGNELRVRSAFGRETLHRISDVVSFTENTTMGEYRLVFRDGSRLKLPSLFPHLEELLERLPENLREG